MTHYEINKKMIFSLFYIITSPDGEGTRLKLQLSQDIYAFNMEASNTFDLLVQQLNLAYKSHQQPNVIFVLNTDQDVQYLLEASRAYNCRVVNVMVRATAHDASSSRICPQANQK